MEAPEEKENTATDLVPYNETSSIELMKKVAEEQNSTAMVKVFDRIMRLEKLKGSMEEVVSASTDLILNYTKPGKSRFKRVVKLRKALENYAKSKE